MAVVNSRPPKKQAISDEVAAHTAAFLSNGGHITQCNIEDSVSADKSYIPPFVIHGAEDCRIPRGKEFLRAKMNMETQDTMLKGNQQNTLEPIQVKGQLLH